MGVYFLVLPLLVSFCHVQASNLEYDGSVFIRLEHAINGGPKPIYMERGNVTIHSLRIGQALVNQKLLTTDDRKAIQKLAIENDLYRIRAIIKSNDLSERTFISTVKACMLAESELDDKLSVSLDHTGRVIGVVLVIASKSSCEGADVPLEKLQEFTTNVYVRHAEMGPMPDTATYVQKIERERLAKEKGDVTDNRSFLAKYWMYIVPVVIIMVISSATNPEAQGGGQ